MKSAAATEGLMVIAAGGMEAAEAVEAAEYRLNTKDQRLAPELILNQEEAEETEEAEDLAEPLALFLKTPVFKKLAGIIAVA